MPNPSLQGTLRAPELERWASWIHMRNLLLLALLAVPSVCFAFGVEDSFYVGISSQGQVTTIGVRSDWDGSAPVPYGSSSKNPVLRYCSHESYDVFQCGARRADTPTIVFKSGKYQRNSDDPTKGSGVRYEEAMTYLRKARAHLKKTNVKAEFDGYYLCEKGCGNDRPLFLFSFIYWHEEP